MEGHAQEGFRIVRQAHQEYDMRRQFLGAPGTGTGTEAPFSGGDYCDSKSLAGDARVPPDQKCWGGEASSQAQESVFGALAG
jgi:hypothetical protein